MIYLKMTAAMSSIRAYNVQDGYENRLSYHAIVTVTHISETFVHLHGAIGKINRETWEKVMILLKEHGITKIQIERHGKLRMIDL